MNSRSPTPTDRRIGRRVREARHRAGMSQKMLAKKLGIWLRQVQKYEEGKNRIGVSRLQAIAETLGRPIAWFFTSPRR